MNPVSRTPEGWDGRCDVCGKSTLIEPSLTGDATCPYCGVLLWPIRREDTKRTQAAIRNGVSWISERASRSGSELGLWSDILPCFVSCLAANGGVVFEQEESGYRKILTSGNALDLRPVDDDEEDNFESLIATVIREGPLLIPPHSTRNGWPTTLLICGVVRFQHRDNAHVVIISQRPDTTPATQRGYLRFVQQMCEIVSSWSGPDSEAKYTLPPKPPKPEKLDDRGSELLAWLNQWEIVRWVLAAARKTVGLR